MGGSHLYTANPSLEAAKVLAEGLGMSLSELLQGL